MAPPRDQLQEYLAAQQQRQQQQQQLQRGGGLPGSDFVVRAFEDGLRALAAAQEEGPGQGQGGRLRRQQQEQDQFEMLTRLAEVSFLDATPS